MEELKCGCGGRVETFDTAHPDENSQWHAFCEKCGIDTEDKYNSEAAAISAFKLATRADSQGIQWISVKDWLPEDSYDKLYLALYKRQNRPSHICLVKYREDDFCRQDFLMPLHEEYRITYLAHINLPKETSK